LYITLVELHFFLFTTKNWLVMVQTHLVYETLRFALRSRPESLVMMKLIKVYKYYAAIEVIFGEAGIILFKPTLDCSRFEFDIFRNNYTHVYKLQRIMIQKALNGYLLQLLVMYA